MRCTVASVNGGNPVERKSCLLRCVAGGTVSSGRSARLASTLPPAPLPVTVLCEYNGVCDEEVEREQKRAVGRASLCEPDNAALGTRRPLLRYCHRLPRLVRFRLAPTQADAQARARVPQERNGDRLAAPSAVAGVRCARGPSPGGATEGAVPLRAVAAARPIGARLKGCGRCPPRPARARIGSGIPTKGGALRSQPPAGRPAAVLKRPTGNAQAGPRSPT